MSSGPVGNPGDGADVRRAKQMFTGWKHLQRSLGVSLSHSVRRSRKLAQSRLRKRG